MGPFLKYPIPGDKLIIETDFSHASLQPGLQILLNPLVYSGGILLAGSIQKNQILARMIAGEQISLSQSPGDNRPQTDRSLL